MDKKQVTWKEMTWRERIICIAFIILQVAGAVAICWVGWLLIKSTL